MRVPVEHRDHFDEQARRIGIARGDYIGFRAALCDGLDIPEAVFRWAPRVILLYDDEAMPGVINRMPPAIIARFREQVPEIADLLPSLPDELPLTG